MFGRDHRRTVLGLGVIGVSGLLLGSVSGCVGYATHDPLLMPETTPRDFRGGLESVLGRALGYTISRFPPSLGAAEASVGEIAFGGDGVVAISLPGELGLTSAGWQRVATIAGEGVMPLSGASKGRPIYRVGRVALRGGRAEVDVHRPTPTGVYQTISVELELKTSGWSVERYRVWTPGAVAPPGIEVAPVDARDAGGLTNEAAEDSLVNEGS